MLLIISALTRGCKSKVNGVQVKNLIKIIAFAIIFIIFWFILSSQVGNYFAKGSAGYYISQFLPVGIAIFISMLIYAITKHQFLSIKLVSAQVLTIAIWILISSQYFFTTSTINLFLITFTLLLSIISGVMLIHFIKAEIQGKKELQIMSDKLAISNSQLIKLDNAKSEFISIASHQLRTPLTAIKGFISLIMEGVYGPVDKKIREVLNKVYLSNERTVELVENLLNISRIESGKMEYKFEKVRIEEMLSELYDNFYVISKSKNLNLVISLPKRNLPEAEIDRVKSKEIISNLIDNAIKYTDQGSVTIKATVSPDNEFIRVSVSDTGIGISKEEIADIFEKFSRGKDQNRLHVTGTGLGLFVGRKMIMAQHGKIWAESDGAGKGATFFVDLPISQVKFQRAERIKGFLEEV